LSSVPYPNTRHVGDRVERAHGKHTDREADISSARPLVPLY
jgi:hypothetical protein